MIYVPRFLRNPPKHLAADRKYCPPPIMCRIQIIGVIAQVLGGGSVGSLVFLSHANPEDNDFTQWLALQLRREGYNAWSDLTCLPAGNIFWRTIEAIIRNQTMKFIYVLSRTSNEKEGPLQELQVALNVEKQSGKSNFIVPIIIDDLPYGDVNILLGRRNIISFTDSWAEGLRRLLEHFKESGIPKDSGMTPDSVASWWRTKFGSSAGLVSQAEQYISNWLPVKSMPQQLYFHEISAEPELREPYLRLEDLVAFPAFRYQGFLMTFAPLEDLTSSLGANLIEFGETRVTSVDDFLAGYGIANVIESPKLLIRLLRMAGEDLLLARGLRTYRPAAVGPVRFYFPKDLIENDRISFMGTSRKTWRQVVGYRSRTDLQGLVHRHYWHYGLQMKPILQSSWLFVFRPYVLFSNDGSNIWDSHRRLQSARRTECKDWWNPNWRDKMLAVLTWLADPDGLIRLRVGQSMTIDMSSTPMMLESQVSYVDPNEEPLADEYGDHDDPGEEEYD